MQLIAMLRISDRPSGSGQNDLSVNFHCPVDVGVNFPDDDKKAEAFVDSLVGHIPIYKRVERTLTVINHFVSLGFRVISVTTTPLYIDSRGVIGETWTDVYLDPSSLPGKE